MATSTCPQGDHVQFCTIPVTSWRRLNQELIFDGCFPGYASQFIRLFQTYLFFCVFACFRGEEGSVSPGPG